MNKKNFTFLAVFLTFLLVMTGCSKNTNTLTIYTWAEMFPQEILDKFTQETGIEINYQNFDFNETMLAKLKAANGGEYDYVLADDYIIESAINEGLVSKLDKSKIKNWNNINPIYQSPYYDRQNQYTVPSGAGIIVLVYRPSKTGFEIKGYRDLWNPALKDNVGIIGNFRVINGLILKMNGKSMNSTDLNEIKTISKDLDSLVPNIRLIKDAFLNDDIVSGEINAGIFYCSQAYMAKLTDPELKIVYPKEGLGFGIQGSFIPSNAPNKEAAYKFIDFLNKPENAAKWFEYLGYYCTNKAAEEYLDKNVAEMLILPDNIDKSNMEIIENIPGQALTLHEEIWTDFLNKCSK